MGDERTAHQQKQPSCSVTGSALRAPRSDVVLPRRFLRGRCWSHIVGRGYLRSHEQEGIVRVTCGQGGRMIGYFARLVVEGFFVRQGRLLILLRRRRKEWHVRLGVGTRRADEGSRSRHRRSNMNTNREMHERNSIRKLRHYACLAA